MSLIGSDIKQYQMANQHSKRLDVTVGTLQDRAVFISALLYISSYAVLVEPFKSHCKTPKMHRCLSEKNIISTRRSSHAILSLSCIYICSGSLGAEEKIKNSKFTKNILNQIPPICFFQSSQLHHIVFVSGLSLLTCHGGGSVDMDRSSCDFIHSTLSHLDWPKS